MLSSKLSQNYQGRRTAKILTAVSGAKISTAQSKFDGSSLLLTTNASDWVTHPLSNDFAFGTGDFCVEGWFYATSWGAGYRTLWVAGNGANVGSFAVYINAGNVLEVYNNAMGPALLSKSGFSMSNNVWYHIAVTRSAGSMRCFKNGTQVGTTVTQNYDFKSAGTLGLIGNDGQTPSFSFVGYIDDLRVTKGAARYTANFTEPSAPLQNDANTSLLCHFTQPNNSTYINDDNL
jgi:hypothetical protein